MRFLRIVLVEDNESLAKGIAYRLQDAGHSVDRLEDGVAADEYLRSDAEADLLILDITLPRLDGLSVLRQMRDRGDARPVLLLTALAETVDRVRGLDAGADDYMVKPFEMAELEARIRALSRRKTQTLRAHLTLGVLCLDLGARQVTIGGEHMPLPRREVSVLEALMTAEGRTVPKSQLLEQVYGMGADVEETAVEVHISRLRKRLAPHGILIHVQRGLGYAIAIGANT